MIEMSNFLMLTIDQTTSCNASIKKLLISVCSTVAGADRRSNSGLCPSGV